MKYHTKAEFTRFEPYYLGLGVLFFLELLAMVFVDNWNCGFGEELNGSIAKSSMA